MRYMIQKRQDDHVKAILNPTSHREMLRKNERTFAKVNRGRLRELRSRLERTKKDQKEKKKEKEERFRRMHSKFDHIPSRFKSASASYSKTAHSYMRKGSRTQLRREIKPLKLPKLKSKPRVPSARELAVEKRTTPRSDRDFVQENRTRAYSRKSTRKESISLPGV